jgi:hypothetical protein
VRQALSSGRYVQCLGGRGQTGDDAGGHVHPAARDGCFEQPPEIQGG